MRWCGGLLWCHVDASLRLASPLRAAVWRQRRPPLCGICPLGHEWEWHFASKQFEHMTGCLAVTPSAEMCFSIRADQSKPVHADGERLRASFVLWEHRIITLNSINNDQMTTFATCLVSCSYASFFNSFCCESHWPSDLHCVHDSLLNMDELVITCCRTELQNLEIRWIFLHFQLPPPVSWKKEIT